VYKYVSNSTLLFLRTYHMSTIDSSIGIAGISFRPADEEQQATGTSTVTAVTGAAAVASFVTSASTSGAASGISFTAAVGTAAGAAGGSAATAATDNDLDTTDSSTTIKYWRVVRMDTTGGLQFETADGDGWKTLMRLDADL
jgi:hypothetical protein